MIFPFVISVPHCSGRIPGWLYPALALTDPEIAESIDVGTQEIFGTLPAQQVLCARWSRLVVDLNRAPGQRGRKGVVPEVDYSGRGVYRSGPPAGGGQVQDRLRTYYWPYHQHLKTCLTDPHIRGLLDCHSLNALGPAEAPDAGLRRKDIVLSNNGDPQGECLFENGAITCAPGILTLMAETFAAGGFSVAINAPYSGGHITTHYGPGLHERGCFAVQVEINQALFMDEDLNRMIPQKLSAVREKVVKCLEAITKTLFFTSPSRRFLVS